MNPSFIALVLIFAAHAEDVVADPSAALRPADQLMTDLLTETMPAIDHVDTSSGSDQSEELVAQARLIPCEILPCTTVCQAQTKHKMVGRFRLPYNVTICGPDTLCTQQNDRCAKLIDEQQEQALADLRHAVSPFAKAATAGSKPSASPKVPRKSQRPRQAPSWVKPVISMKMRGGVGCKKEIGRMCHYNYLDGGSISVDACKAKCANQPGCTEFSVNGKWGCRYAKTSHGCCSNVPGANMAQYCYVGKGWNAAHAKAGQMYTGCRGHSAACVDKDARCKDLAAEKDKHGFSRTAEICIREPYKRKMCCKTCEPYEDQIRQRLKCGKDLAVTICEKGKCESQCCTCKNMADTLVWVGKKSCETARAANFEPSENQERNKNITACVFKHLGLWPLRLDNKCGTKDGAKQFLEATVRAAGDAAKCLADIIKKVFHVPHVHVPHRHHIHVPHRHHIHVPHRHHLHHRHHRHHIHIPHRHHVHLYGGRRLLEAKASGPTDDVELEDSLAGQEASRLAWAKDTLKRKGDTPTPSHSPVTNGSPDGSVCLF